MPRRDFDSDLDDMPRRRRRRARKQPKTNPALIVVCVGACLLLVIGATVAGYFLYGGKLGLPGFGRSADRDLDRLAGRWECTFRDPTGQITMHKVKEISGTTETATWYRPDGTVFRINRVEFQLDVRGKTKVFRYFNGWVVDGPGAGQPFPSGEYAYELDGDKWTEYGPSGETIVWTRQ